jgi:PAS domain S-box-containing protein
MQFSSQDNMDSKQGIDAIFQFATEGILVANDKSEIVNINPSAEKLFGYDKGELIGKKIEVLIPKRYSETHIKQRDDFHHNPHARSMGAGMELYGAKKGGAEFPVEISLSPYSSPEGKFVVAFILDITLRKQAEAKLKNYSADLEKQVGNRTLILQEAITELEKTKHELNAALEKEKELNEMKTRFVSMASHEFRTPLATIMSSLSLVKAYGDQNDTEKQHRHIHKIKSSISNLTDILNDFLSISKLEEGKVENLQEIFGIESFIKDVISEMEPLCKKDQKIIYVHQGDDTVLIDKKLLKNILFNLLSNALKFSNEGSFVNVVTDRSNAKLTLSVEDNGIGISEKDQKNLFQRFFRARNASNIQGTGLGLNIIENYIELMSGSIEFKSVENEGTTFKLTFPQ